MRHRPMRLDEETKRGNRIEGQRRRREHAAQIATEVVVQEHCVIEGCGKANIAARGLCWAHYNRERYHGDPNHKPKIQPQQGRLCSVAGCKRPAKARGWCGGHYGRVLATGDPGSVTFQGEHPKHGSTSTYRYHGCRCQLCVTALRTANHKQKRDRAERLRAGLVSPEHGTTSTYRNYGCRCAPCTKANATQMREYKLARRAKEAS